MSKAAIIDANVNRFKEGARVLEDIARFVLKDNDLFTQIKALKHMAKIKIIDRTQVKDIGGADFVESQQRLSWVDLVNANALRMQEAARVLEEIDDRMLYKSARFRAYEIHSKLLIKLQCMLKTDKLHGLYAICDPHVQPLDTIYKKVQEQGITLCQIRMKHASKKDIWESTKALKAKLGQGTLLIVNDHLDVALNLADGVHLGQSDLPITVARQLVPPGFIVGVTCHTVEQAVHACHEGASYIGVGCLYPTQTKKNTISCNLKTLKEIVAAVAIPVCAIGGINQSNQEEVSKTGVKMMAMYSALWDP